MVSQSAKVTSRLKRRRRIRKVVKGTMERPRLSFFRSLKHVYIQVIDDTKGQTLFSASDKEIQKKDQNCTVKVATQVGELIAKKAQKKGIKKLAFDRGGYLYHGQAKAVAEGIRKGGIQI